MDYPHKIQGLLDKYWETETTLEEERELKAFFNDHPEYSDPAATYFRLLTEEHSVAPPVAIAEPGRTARIRNLRIRALAVAASFALILIAGYAISTFGPVGEKQVATPVEITDPDIAYAEARDALLVVARTMNQSQRKAARQIEKVEPYTDIIGKQTENED